MGNQQAHRAVNEQVADRGRRRSRAAGRSDGRPVAVEVAAMAVRAAARTDRLVAWREERSSRQVFNNKFKQCYVKLISFYRWRNWKWKRQGPFL